MPLFPFFVNIKGAHGIITGGGRHALEKVEKLLPYGPRLQVIAPEFLPAMEDIPALLLTRRSFQETDLETEPAFVIAAGADPEENHWIARLCRERRIPVNVVDDKDHCDFVFPALVNRGELSVGISTNGASPSVGALMKRRVEEQIPDRMEEILDFLQEKRPAVSQAIPDKKRRFAFLKRLAEDCMEEGRPLTEEEFAELLREETEEIVPPE